MTLSGKSVEAVIAAGREAHRIPALGAVVVRSDSAIALHVSGVRRIGRADSVGPGDRFHLGSNAKAMTAVLIASLVTDGTLAWSTSPVDVLPELRDSIHPGYAHVTMEQLLTHTAGVPAFTSGFATAFLPDSVHRQGTRSRAQWRRAFAVHVLRREPDRQPGTTSRYSNAGYTIAAVMAEAVTGKPWEALLEERVFRPLGISAAYGWPAATDPAQPWGHWKRFLRGLRLHDPNGLYTVGALLAPAGDVSMSLGEYGRFLQEHLKGLRGVDGLLPAHAVQWLHTPRGEFAAGWLVQHRDGMRLSVHEGSAGTFHAAAIVAPEADVAIAVAANAGSRAAAEAVRAVAAVLVKQYVGGELR